MKIIKTSQSRLSKTDFTNLPFGRVFSDHMLICNFKNNKWQTPEIVPYGPIEMTPATQALHYGQSIFEGMKAFKNDSNEILLFRKKDNLKRLNRSAKRLSIPEIPDDIFLSGLDQLLHLDQNWCIKDDSYSLYIRPFIFASAEYIKACESDEYKFVIITSPTTTYYTSDIDVIIEEKYTRAASGGVGFAKASGNYAASFYPAKIAKNKGFTQIIWTDAKEHRYIEEAGTMNIWFVIDNKLITPKLTDSILAGITRDSVIKIANDLNIEVEEREVSVEELIEANKNHKLQEAFGTGTAVTISPINSITYRDEKIIITKKSNPKSLEIKTIFQNIQRGRYPDKYSWVSKLHV